MNKKFNWKKFLKGFVLFLPLAVALDVVYDLIFKELIWKETFAMQNMFFKIAAALIGAYFYATIDHSDSKK